MMIKTRYDSTHLRWQLGRPVVSISAENDSDKDAPEILPSHDLLLFTSMRANYSKPTSFRRSQLGVVSMMKLARQAQQRNPALRVNLRVLLLVDFPEECPVLLQKLSALDDRVWDKEHRGARDSGRSSQYPFVASDLLGPEADGVSAPSPYDYPICRAATTCLHPVYNIPTMDCLFRSALSVALPDEYIMFTNSDIVYSTELLNIYVQARDAVTEFPHGFSMFGRRKDVVLEEEDLYHNNVRNASSKWRNSRALKVSSGSSLIANLVDRALSDFDSIFRHVANKMAKQSVYSAPRGVDFFLMPQWGFPLNFPPLMIGRALWDNVMMSALIRNGNSAHPGPPAIHVTQSVTSIHMGAASEWGTYNGRKGAEWTNFVGINHTLARSGATLFTQYYSRGYCNITESARTSNCKVVSDSIRKPLILDGENKVKGPGIFVTKSGFVFAKRHNDAKTARSHVKSG
jgi:hypothetical protein